MECECMMRLATAVKFLSALPALRDPLTLQRILGVDHGLAGHGRPCPGGRGVVVRAVEGELSGLLHIELAPAGDTPSQLLTADTALDRRAACIVRARARREGRRQVARLIRRQTARALMRRSNHSAGLGAA